MPRFHTSLLREGGSNVWGGRDWGRAVRDGRGWGCVEDQEWGWDGCKRGSVIFQRGNGGAKRHAEYSS
jgi:hypothetical protein